MSNQKQGYLFVGDDDYPMGVAAREVVNRLVPPDQQAFGLEIIEGRAEGEDDILATIKRCREALVTPAFMMAGNKVIWWRSVTFTDDALLLGKDSIKEAMKDLATVIEDGHAGSTVLVMTAKGVDKRSAFYKMAAARFEVREFLLPEKAYQVEQFGRAAITRILKEKGLSADEAVVEMILDRVGVDSRTMASELEKLSLYLGSGKRVTAGDVAAVVSRSATSVTWDLQDALGERKVSQAIDILRDLLANRESDVRIISALASRIRDLQAYREALDQGWLRVKGAGRYATAQWSGIPADAEAGLTRVLRRPPSSIHPFQACKMAEQARHYSPSELVRNQRLLLEAYERLVTSSVPAATILEFVLVRLMAPQE